MGRSGASGGSQSSYASAAVNPVKTVPSGSRSAQARILAQAGVSSPTSLASRTPDPRLTQRPLRRRGARGDFASVMHPTLRRSQVCRHRIQSILWRTVQRRALAAASPTRRATTMAT
ncbi:hypothetical protein ACFX43_12770 [Nocardioides sp. YIM B13467]|uniref:hypothetical protein n=1 Tax=Nocardioides sp. YIM B13467 TaxID=3366294 RepID=UPI00366AE0DC